MRRTTPDVLGGQAEVIDAVVVALGETPVTRAVVVAPADFTSAWEMAYQDAGRAEEWTKAFEWQQAAERWIKRYPSPSTQRAYKESWRAFFAWVQRAPWQVLSSDAIGWQESLIEAGLKPASVNRYLAALSSFYSFVRRDLVRQPDGSERSIFVDGTGRLCENPFRAAGLERRKKGPSSVNPLSKSELRAMRDAINTSTRTGARDMALFECYLRTGRRLKEIIRLRWKDLDGTRNGGHKFWWTGKGADRNPEKKTGWRVLPASAHAAIVAYLKADGRWPVEDPEMYIFQPLSDHGTATLRGAQNGLEQNRHISAGHVNGIVKKWARRAGIDEEKVHVHVLRHSFAFHLYSQTKDYELVRNLLDHEDLKTTVGYIGSMEEPEDRHSQALQQALGF